MHYIGLCNKNDPIVLVIERHIDVPLNENIAGVIH